MFFNEAVVRSVHYWWHDIIFTVGFRTISDCQGLAANLMESGAHWSNSSGKLQIIT